MATLQTSAYMDATTYNNFAGWAKWALAGLVTLGWVPTSDTGQVNWTDLAASNAVPISSSNTGWNSSTAALSIGLGAAGVACSAASGLLVIAVASTTGFVAGKTVALGAYDSNGTNLTGTSGITNLNGLLFTIKSIVANTSITLTVPTSGSIGSLSWSAGFSYTATAGTLYIQPSFAILESNDTLTSSTPIYVKLEFGQYSNNTSQWCRIQIGTGGTNGYGSLSGITSAKIFVCPYNFDNGNLRPCYLAGNAGNFRMLLTAPMGAGTYDAYAGLWIVLSRSKDASGNDTINSVQIWTGAYNQLSTFQTVYAAGTNNVDTSGFLIALAGVNASGSWGVSGVSTVSPVFQNIGGFSNPNADLLCGGSTDFKNGTLAVISVYGVNHSYIVFCNTQAMPHIGPNSTTQNALLFRFE